MVSCKQFFLLKEIKSFAGPKFIPSFLSNNYGSQGVILAIAYSLKVWKTMVFYSSIS